MVRRRKANGPKAEEERAFLWSICEDLSIAELNKSVPCPSLRWYLVLHIRVQLVGISTFKTSDALLDRLDTQVFDILMFLSMNLFVDALITTSVYTSIIIINSKNDGIHLKNSINCETFMKIP